MAREMEREGFTVPLLIGGATTSRAHTAVRIAPAYTGPVVHVLDASRAVGVVSQLKSAASRPAFDAENRREQERLRQEHASRRSGKPLVAIEEARRRRTRIDWAAYEPPQPSFHGARELEVPLAELVPFIDWTPFFSAWELRGTYPRIFENPEWGSKARELFDDAQALLERLVEGGRLKARAVYGFFPANAAGDDIEVYADASRSGRLGTLHTLRQQADKGEGEAALALADFVAPRESGLADWIGAFAVTAGLGAEELAAAPREGARRLRRDHGEGARRPAGGGARRVAAQEGARRLGLRRRGVALDRGASAGEVPRDPPGAGLSGLPGPHREAAPLRPARRRGPGGIQLTETFAMRPAASVCGFYFAHPQARYFALGRIGRDQVVDYPRRKGMDLRAVERWLAPNLDYDPAEAEPRR